MAINSCRVVAAAKDQEPLIHVLWQDDAAAGLAPGAVPATAPDFPFNIIPANCMVTRPPGASALTLNGWNVATRAQPKLGEWAIRFTPTPAADLSWMSPSALVEFLFDFEGQPNQVVIDPDGWSELEQEIGTQGGRILHALGKADIEEFSRDSRDGLSRTASNIEDLIGFPLITSGADGAGPAGGAAAPGGKALVDSELRRVLGRVPTPGDVTGTLALLDRAMELTIVDGVQRWEVRPGGAYVTQNDIGAGVTGRQASVAGLARDTLEQIQPLVDQVEPLAIRAENPSLLETARSNFLASASEAVAEAAVAGGPLRIKAEVLLDQSLSELANLGTELGVLRFSKKSNLYVPTRRNVLNLHDEEHYTRFLVILDRWRVFDEFFREYLGFKAKEVFFVDQARTKDFGLRFTILDRSIDVISEAVDELDSALLSVGVDRAEREAIDLGFGDDGTLADLMDWAKGFSANEARPLIQNAGIRGARLLPARLSKLLDAVKALITRIDAGGGLPGDRALRHPRVKVALDKLRRELDGAKTEATEAAHATDAAHV
jgi:hypothetical protein